MRRQTSAGLLIAMTAGFALLPDPRPMQAQGCDATSACIPEPDPAVPLPPPPVLPGDEVVITLDLIDEGSTLLVGQAARPQETARIVSRISEAFGFCAAIQNREYIVDCVSQQFESVAESLPRTGDYAPVRSVLADTSARLGALVEANRSPDLPLVTARSPAPDGPATDRPLRPVATERVDAVIAQAAAIVEEAESVLLLSDADDEQTVAFRSVAGALETGTVLLLAS